MAVHPAQPDRRRGPVSHGHGHPRTGPPHARPGAAGRGQQPRRGHLGPHRVTPVGCRVPRGLATEPGPSQQGRGLRPAEGQVRRLRPAVPAAGHRIHAEQWDRIGQFYAAVPAGHATASAALQRLNRFQASNRCSAANRELGRALKTEFVLQDMSEPHLRATVRRGLLKVEQLHALARVVSYGQRGRISARAVYDQVTACACLTLILACIVSCFIISVAMIAGAVGALGAGLTSEAARWLWVTFLAVVSSGWATLAAWWNS